MGLCVCWGGGAVTGSLSLLLSSKCQYRPSILGTTADFYKFPNVGFNRGTSSEDLGSLSVTEEVSVTWLCSEGAGGLWRALLTPCPGLLRTAELFPSSLYSPLLVVSSAFSLLPPPSLGLPHFYLLLFLLYCSLGRLSCLDVPTDC